MSARRAPGLGLQAVLLLALGVLAGAPGAASAQIAMPDPALINGKAIPAPELASGTVTVRVVRESVGNNLPGQTVRVTTGNASRTATTDEQGRATFPNLPGGVEGRAEVTVGGEHLVSDPFQVPTSGGLRVILVAGLEQAAARRAKEAAEAAAAPPVKGTVVLGQGTRVLMDFSDDALQVYYMLEIVNNARNRVDIGGPLVIDLPSGASGAATLEGSAPAVVNGDRITIPGPFASGSTMVQVGYTLRYDSPDVTFTQAWPVATEETAIALERIGDVRFSSPQFNNVGDITAGDGLVYMLASGPGLPAGGVLTVQLSGLPVHSRTPRYVGLGLAAVIIAVGVWLSVTGGTREEDARARLQARRDALLAEVAALETRRRAGSLDAAAAARLQAALGELERIFGELDAAGSGPQGGGEGLAA